MLSKSDNINGDYSVIHIAVAFDQNYFTPFYALAASILQNNKKNKTHFHVIATGIASSQRANLECYIVESGNTISFHTIDDKLVSQFVLLDKWTAAVYYRLFFPLLLSENISRLLYLDVDTIVIKDLTELYFADLEIFPLAAVYDNYVKTQSLIGIYKEEEYFNSGVLLIDLKRWREQSITEQAIDYLTKYPERIRFVDQCALNAVLHKNWKRLPEKFNLLYSYLPGFLNKKNIPEFLTDKVIIHYTLQRPWSLICKNRLAFLYHHYLSLSPIGRTAKRYSDLSLKLIPEYFRIQLMNLYFDIPAISSFWKSLKRLR